MQEDPDFQKGDGAVEKMKPIFVHHEGSKHKAYQRQMRSCSDLIPECFLNQVSYLPVEKSCLITVSRAYELEAVRELYDELESPVPEKLQRKLLEEERKAWYGRARAAHAKFGSAIQVREAMPIHPGRIYQKLGSVHANRVMVL